MLINLKYYKIRKYINMHTLKLFLTITLINTAIINSATAGDGHEEKPRVIYIESAKYTLPLLEKWVTEYNKTNPEIQVEWAAKSSENIDLRIVANVDMDNENFSEDGKTIIYIGRSALLPVTTKENPLYEKIAKKKFGKKDLKRLFFAEDPFGEGDSPKDKFKEQLTVYSGSSKTSGATFFASYFGQNSSDFRGKKIQGDDIYLLHAIGKDPTGITFNNLSYIYDLKDRQLKDDITLLPLDLKKDQLEIIKSENLDQTISLLENEKVELIPVLNIGLTYDKQADALQFLRWIINTGQRFNHEFGFLQVDEKTLSHQKNLLGDVLLTNK
jgi:ABC-type phosphate transport system substrate-binding protein